MNKPDIKIEDYNRIDFPKKLYKHYSLSKNSVSVLGEKNNPYLFFSHPNQLNDLLDGSMYLLDLKNIEFDKYSLLLQGIYKHLGIDNKAFINDNSTEKLKKNFKIHQETDFYEVKLLLSLVNSFATGILSLTETSNNNLLWAHYSGEDGFVIEFNIDNLVTEIQNKNTKTYIFPINYLEKIYTIDVAEYLKFENNKLDLLKPILYYVSTKVNDWIYEKEWRILIQKNKLGFTVNKLDFESPKLRDKILNQETKKEDIFDIKNRKIEITRKSISKIIVGPYFFNNQYFSNTKSEKNIVSYLFKTSIEISNSEFEKLQNFVNFLKLIKEHYSGKMEQVEITNTYDENGNNYLERKITKEIFIEEITNYMLVIKITEN